MEGRQKLKEELQTVNQEIEVWQSGLCGLDMLRCDPEAARNSCRDEAEVVSKGGEPHHEKFGRWSKIAK